jgi:hypothetical protein
MSGNAFPLILFVSQVHTSDTPLYAQILFLFTPESRKKVILDTSAKREEFTQDEFKCSHGPERRTTLGQILEMFRLFCFFILNVFWYVFWYETMQQTRSSI